MIWIIIGVLVIAFIFLVGFNVKKTKAWQVDEKELLEGLETIKRSQGYVDEILKPLDLSKAKRYSSFGYNFIQYRNKYKAPDNLNIILDDEKRIMIFYMLLPYTMEIINYSDIKGAEIVEFYKGQSVPKGSTEKVDSIVVEVKLKKNISTVVGVSANDNIPCFVGDEKYNEAYEQAKKFKSIIDDIAKSNKKGN